MKKIFIFYCVILGIPSVSMASNGLGYHIEVVNYSKNDIMLIANSSISICISSVYPSTITLKSNQSTTITVVTNDYKQCNNDQTSSLQYFDIFSSDIPIGQAKFGLNSYTKGRYCANYRNEGTVGDYAISPTMTNGNKGYHTQNMKLHICNADDSNCNEAIMGNAGPCI